MPATDDDAARALLAADLHDGPLQALAAVVLEVAHLRGQAAALVPGPAGELLEGRLDDVLARLAAVDAELRSTLWDGGAAEDGDLLAALALEAARVEDEGGLAVELALDPAAGVVAPARARQLVRLARGALANVVRHAVAGRVGIAVSVRGEELVLRIEDDGVGFDPERARASGRLGLAAMAARAAALGGSLVVDSRPGGPTAIETVVPLAPDER